MDYSQFLAMKQEIGLLIVFLLVFLYDTFMPRKSQTALPAVSTVLMLLFTLTGFCGCCCGASCTHTAFAGMYEAGAVITAIKNVLNIGVVLVMIQSIKWANSENMQMRRGEFYELLQWWLSTKTATRATRLLLSTSSPPFSHRQCSSWVCHSFTA
jgi:NADH-quinone oxidoreductase subunit N